MAELNTNIRGEQIRDNTIDEVKLNVHNAPTDGYFLSWNDSESKFEWTEMTSSTATSETPSGSLNGSNTTFTLSNSPISGSLAVYLNGLYQEEGAGKDYELSGTTITFTVAPLATDILLVAYLQSAAVGGALDAKRYSLAFTNGDLSSGVLSVTHSLGQQYVVCQVYDNDEELINPDEVTLQDANSLDVDLTSYGTLSGTWHVVCIG
jgi:hypothetical protein